MFYHTLQGPVVIVPTKYYKTPTQHFRDMGVSMVIWANHNLRASVKAIQQTTAQIYKDQSLTNVENEVGVSEIQFIILNKRSSFIKWFHIFHYTFDA